MTTQVTQAYQAMVFISMILVLIPIRWHLHAWNTGTCLYMMWVAIGCLNQFINAVVWQNDAILRGLVWCDISTHLQIALGVAMPACSLVINRRLYKIANVKTVFITADDKRKEMMVDLAIGLGIPILSMIIYIIPQGHRFDIFEELGCMQAMYNTLPALLLVTAWPLFLGTISAVYTCLILYTFAKRSAQFNKLIESNPSLTISRYWRLMAMTSMELLFTIPLSAYVISLNVPGIQPWISWANVHEDFGHINQYPSISWRMDPVGERGLELQRWSYVLCALLFFAFFGFAAEARKNYRSAWSSLSSMAGRKIGSGSSGKTAVSSSFGNGSKLMASNATGGVLPVFIRKERSVNPDASFTSTLSIPPINSFGEFDEKTTSPIDSVLSPTDTYNATDSFDGKSSRPATPDSDVGNLPRLPRDMV